MTSWLPRWFAVLFLVLPFVPVVADDPDDKVIEGLVKQLGSDKFKEREAAMKRLTEIGEPALAALRKAAMEGANEESRARATALVKAFQHRLDRGDCASVPPPKGAVILFDGKGLEGWVQKDGKTAPAWKVLAGGILEVSHSDIMTRQTFAGAFQLHVEFRVPEMPWAKGQARGNSGVFLQGRYEIQILDSYGLPCNTQSCAAVYGLVAPTTNACKAPGFWQSFDIEFQPPEYLNDKKVTDACVTVMHNGVKVHHAAKVVQPTASGLPGDPSGPGPVLLQAHGAPVQFRNLWLLPLPKG